MTAAGETATKDTLLAEAKQYLDNGRKVITINAEKKPTLEKWTPLRDMDVSIEQVNEWLSSPLAERIAVLLDKSLLAFDYDGAGEYIIWDKLVPRCTPELQTAFRQTTLTKTPHGGHVLFGIDAKEFPEGLKEIQCWWNGKEHNQIILLSQNKYLVERGTGYKAIRGIDFLVSLSEAQVSELINLLQRVKSETIAIKAAVDVLLPHYYNTNRDNLTFALSGFLHKGGLEEYLIKDVQEYLMDTTGLDTTQERQERFNVIKNTCVKDRNSGEVSGKGKFLEAVNNNENVLTTILKAFKPLGYFKEFDSSDKKKKDKDKNKEDSNNKEPTRPEPKITNEFVQFYIEDNMFSEAVTIGNSRTQRFALVNTETKEISLVSEITIDTDWDEKGENVTAQTVYRPLENKDYMCKPYTFESEKDFYDKVDFVKNHKFCTLDGIYQTVKRIWSKYIDAENEHLVICAADTIFTYFQDIIGITHYLWFVGDNDSGKSNNLWVLHYLAYRNMMSIGISSANVYQFLGNEEEGIGTICEDEANKIDEDQDKMDLAKSGYTKGFPVVRISISSNGQRHQKRYNTFCFKAYAAEKAPDVIKAKGMIQRLVKLRCIAGDPAVDILEVVNPVGDTGLTELLKELNGVRNLLLCYRLVHRSDKIRNITVNLKNREKQLFKPVLRLFYGTRALDEIKTAVEKYIDERRKTKSHGLNSFLIQVVKDMLTEKGYNDITVALSDTFELPTSDIWLKVKTLTDATVIPGHPLTCDTTRFGPLSQRKVVEVLEDVFKAEVKSSNSVRNVRFTKKDLIRVINSYDIKDAQIEISGPAPESESESEPEKDQNQKGKSPSQ
jgi:hypothetical protein